MSDGTSTKPREYETVGQIIADRDRLRSRLREAEALLRNWCDVCAYAEVDAFKSAIRNAYYNTRAFLASGTESKGGEKV